MAREAFDSWSVSLAVSLCADALGTPPSVAGRLVGRSGGETYPWFRVTPTLPPELSPSIYATEVSVLIQTCFFSLKRVTVEGTLIYICLRFSNALRRCPHCLPMPLTNYHDNDPVRFYTVTVATPLGS
jgi:hypothetical protein